MSLTSSERQELHDRLAPVIGEEEARTLLDQLPSDPSLRPVTEARLDAAVSRLGHRIDMLEVKMDAEFDQVDSRFEHLDSSLDTRFALQKADILGEMHRALRQQLLVLMTVVLAAISIVAAVS